MKTRVLTCAAWLAGALALAAPASAQRNRPHGTGDRTALEQQVRERFAQVVQQRLALTDDQMHRLQETSRGFESRRRTLLERERTVRRGLRTEMTAPSPDQQRIGSLLDQLLDVQRQRLDLVSDEQKQLAQFMTPLQRAKYLALQDQLRRRIEAMRRPPAPRRGGPPR